MTENFEMKQGKKNKKKAKLALIDAHALIHRAYHALPPMSTRSGVPTNAVYGFALMFLKMLTTLKPTHVVAAFDMKGPTFRHREFKDYKAQRAKAPDELVSQFDLVREYLKAFNVPIVEKEGFEADDIIGTLVREVDGGISKVIVTGDLDTLQLVDKDTSVFTLKRGVSDTVLYTEAMVKERYGFDPDMIADYKGLRGDPSDNIPGVEGIGEKTAKELVAEYGKIEDIYKHLEELSARASKKLKGHKSEAVFSRKLATIRQEVKVDFDLDRAVMADYDVADVRELLQKLELKSLLQRLPGSTRDSQMTLLGKDKDKKLPSNYHPVIDKEGKEDLKKRLLREGLVAFDTETDGLGAREYPVVGMSFAVRVKGKSDGSSKGIEAWYVPTGPGEIGSWKELLEGEGVNKVGHNMKYDMEVLAQSGVSLNPVKFDSMIASYLLHPGARQHSLDTLAVQELGHHPIPITQLIGEGKKQRRISEVSELELTRYACEDAELTLRLYEKLLPEIKREDLEGVLNDLELPLIPVLARMELAGVKLDKKKLVELARKIKKRLGFLAKKIWEEAGEEFNINSTQQLRKILYEKMKLPTDGIVRTQSGYSTAAAELKKLEEKHIIISFLEEYRELSKLYNTYIETLPELVKEETGRVYASFNQTITATGRLSSSDPNLQNIPVRTETGQKIREAFVAERGNVLVKADYSQIELRLVAHMSKDEKMLEAFRVGEDIHRSTAAWVYGIKLGEVTKKQRSEAKALNFGVLYGMGPQKFAREAGVSKEEARSFIEKYFEKYVGLSRYMEEILDLVREVGYVETLLGRKRYIPEINSRAPAVRAQAERAAINFPVQGTAADVLKKAMIVLYDKMQADFPEALMVLTVHDELVCEIKKENAEQLANTMKKCMEGVISLDVPLVAEVSIGKNWQNVKKVTE